MSFSYENCKKIMWIPYYVIDRKFYCEECTKEKFPNIYGFNKTVEDLFKAIRYDPDTPFNPGRFERK